MLATASRLGVVLGFALVVAAFAGACSGTGSGHTTIAGAGGGHGGAGTGATGNGGGDGGISFISSTGSSCGAGLDVQPATLQTITVTAGQTMPTVTFDATLNCSAVSAGWTVDQGNVGTVPAGPSASAVFTPTGKAGGLVNVTAGLNGKTVTRQVMVKLTSQQNGADGTNPAEQAQIPSTVDQLTAGGGVGGVGGEGLGGAVTDTATVTALGSPSSNGQAQGLAFLYPYDKTVWPRGMLAPLLMWTWTPPGGAAPGDADAIRIQLSTKSGSFSYTGTFGPPAILKMSGGKFIRMPIPQDVWDMATNSAAGAADPLTVSLTVAKGGVAYGPISETWTIAPAHLSGTIYYQSYGTNYAQNSSPDISIGTGMQFGGAVLSIHVGDTAPKLVAGASGGPAQCRVCHSVAAQGARLVVQHGDNGYGTSSAYDLGTAPATEHVLSYYAQLPAMYPDGSLALTEGAQLVPLPAGNTSLPTTGLTSVATDLGTPAFSPDGTKLVFNAIAGPAVKPNQTLYVMSYDNGTHAFSAPTLVADDTGKPAATRPGWPAFFPDSKSVVYHHQTGASVDPPDQPPTIYTRAGSLAQIYWTNLTGPSAVTPLDNLNGKGYLPKLPAKSTLTCTADGTPVGVIDADHSDDVDHNYEPTVNPIASGGYAWVVFTSRRMYGSEATIPPFCSDPRGVDLIKNITPKKLWVAAIDLTQAPGTDSSHPAFYLPAQELLAGNSRGFWVLDPCQADGASCQTGDQCCNGYCEPGDGGALVCTNAPPAGTCSGVGDKCTTASDCCDPTDACINGFCAIMSPQ